MSATQTTEEARAPAARRLPALLSLSTDTALSALLAAIGVVGALLRFNDQLTGLTGDNATYILLARDLITGSPYENAGYPWGYPALLSPVLAIAGPDNMLAAVPWMKLLTIALFAAALPIIYLLLRTRHPAWAAFAATALFAVNDLALLYANDVMSEIPYTCVTFGALLYWQRAIDPWLRDSRPGPTPWRRRLRSLVPSGLSFVAAYYIRTVGVALLVAPVVVLLWYRKVRPALLLGALFVLLALPWLLASRDSNLNSYADQLLLRDPFNPGLGRVSTATELLGRVLGTGWLYLSYIFPSMLLPDGFTAALPGGMELKAVVFPVVSLLIVGGLLLRLLRGVALPEVYVVGFLLLLFVWPWNAGRFLLPIYPLLLHYLMESGICLSRRLAAAPSLVSRLTGRQAPGPDPPLVTRDPRLAKGIVVALLAFAALPQLWLSAQAASANAQYLAGQAPPAEHTPDWQSFFAACRWLKDNTPPGSVVMSRKPTIATIYSGRPSVQIPLVPPTKYPDYLHEYKVAYLIEDAFPWSTHTQNYLRPALSTQPELYEQAYITRPPTVRVWKVVR